MNACRAHRPSPSPAIACALLAAILLPAAAAAQTVTLRQGDRHVNIAVGDASALPADFPPDVPLPAPYTLTRVERSDDATTVVMAVPGDAGDEAERFRARMLSGGWAAASVAPPPSGVAQAWTKARRAVVAWFAPGASGGARVQLQILERAR